VICRDRGQSFEGEALMRVFVTGATGFIGSAVVRDLIAAGHQVTGLARGDAAADALAAQGVQAHCGDLADPGGLAAAAAASDGVIHTAFGHNFDDYAAAVETDRRVVEAMVAALEGSGKPLVIASGTLMVAHARPATETDDPVSLDAPRARSEAAVLAARGVRGAVVRLAPSVHDRTRSGLITRLIALAGEKGVSPYVGGGETRWPAVHCLDAARLFCLALEQAAAGSRLHAAAEEGVTMRAIAEAIGERLGVPARGIPADQAAAHFEWFAPFVTMDNPTSSAITRETLGWRPREVGLLDDIRHAEFT
jgi:nucleoside-diphosphate-sugar epimerase